MQYNTSCFTIKKMHNALTVDVEDYFHVTAFERCIKCCDWGNMPLRVVDNTKRVLDLFDSHSVKATFFILGWVAERCPELVKDISERGHEIASHGYGHQLVYNIGPDSFRDDLRRSKQLLQDLCGKEVEGYRAPSYSITKKSEWALDILIEEGFKYDSSIFPIMHDIYGMPEAPRFPHIIQREAGTIKEFPITTYPLRLLGRELRLPVAGGGYLRLLPVKFIAKAIKSINKKEGMPAVIYFHPWEIDPGQPRITAPLKSRFRHYTNLSKTEEKLEFLLTQFKFARQKEVLENCLC
ncbi:MAG: DUF3473 domain-containing protein [Dissulfurispiraceae bacterium]|jgi:polysaccharide deacetylase family protein (PEP-CTERM system associated)|nr:DUF3473 domain-containing protein [Dissulfurispiraceae bacterium]